jgi:hypothetical protein
MNGILATDSKREAMDKLNTNYAFMNRSINLQNIYSACKAFIKDKFPLTQNVYYSNIATLVAEIVPNSNRNEAISSVRRVFRREVKT